MLQELITIADKDGSGSLDFPEFLNMMKEKVGKYRLLLSLLGSFFTVFFETFVLLCENKGSKEHGLKKKKTLLLSLGLTPPPIPSSANKAKMVASPFSL